MRTLLLVPLALLLAVAAEAADKRPEGIDPEVLIRHILAVDSVERALLHDVMYDAEYVEREQDESGRYVDKTRFVKKVYVRYDKDTAWYHEVYLEYYVDGQLQSSEALLREAADRMEKKQSRGTRDISYRMLRPFYPSVRGLYEIEYLGVPEGTIDDYVCHHFRIRAREQADSLFNGDFYFESSTFHLVRVDFSPAKLTRSVMFKLSEMNMSIAYSPVTDDIWLPRQFDIAGRGRAAFLFGVKFAGTEYYRDPVVNSGLSDTLFAGERND
jgi:hypothetical protein